MPPRARLANDAWESLLSAHAVLLRELAAQDAWGDLTMREYDVLYTLSKQSGPVRMGELHRHVLLSQPALSRLVDRLAARGLVGRTGDPADGRSVRVALTEEGRDRQRRTGRLHARGVAEAMASRLDAEELRLLQALCDRLSQPADGPHGGADDTDQEPRDEADRR